MPCSKEEGVARLFYNVSTSFVFLFLFFYFSFIILAKLFSFLSNVSIFRRAQIEYGAGMFSDEEEEEEEARYFRGQYVERDHLVADIVHGGERETLEFFSPEKKECKVLVHNDQTMKSAHADEHFFEDQYLDSTQMFDDDDTSYSEPEEGKDTSLGGDDSAREDSNQEHEDSNQEHEDADPSSPITLELDQNGSSEDDKNHNKKCDAEGAPEESKVTMKSGFSGDEKFLIFEPPKLETKKVQLPQEEVFGDSCTVGSTSKSSSEWRSSIFCRDSATEDPFSSSSRRSCPKWESYTVFQKYDEEMLFLDRISAQKLHETESLKSFHACPRSISDRIVYKLSTLNKKPQDTRRSNPHTDLECAYVAQICLTWEALNWNYKKFQGYRSSRKGDVDPGCPARVAQQFQQFQVLLQRYIENEPYERGRRPEIYAKMRLLAPKLLQVPEYRDSDDDEKKEDGFNSRISSASFLMIMEDGIQTFMNFLKADKGKHCQIIKYFFRRNRRISVDPTLLHIVKKENKKKKLKLKALNRPRNCLRKRRLNVEEEMEIMMGLIDLKVVSRVLRMADLSEEQLHWCEEKMGKVRIKEGKLQRDSDPLFFPAH